MITIMLTPMICLMIGHESQEMGFTGKKKVHTVEQMNEFLDVTRNLRKPQVEELFPDLPLFLASGSIRRASFEEPKQTKRYRLKRLRVLTYTQHT